MKTLAQGAEATIQLQSKNIILKTRIAKSYRYPALDEKLRKLRTRQESKLLEKAHSIISTPKILDADEQNKTLSMQHIPGKKLAENFETLKLTSVCKQIGASINKLHSAGIIHGDLTTSNMIYNSKNTKKAKAKVYIIDFGLGFQSIKDEDKAVDLHVLKEALQAKHPTIYAKAWSAIAKAYTNKKVLKRLEKVESRGRYKNQD